MKYKTIIFNDFIAIIYNLVMNIHKILASWFIKMKRDLPWRHTSDPYKIWLSEIILQQTRVNQGISYYEKFIAAFPDIFTLAEAKIDSVLKTWQGLGYYARARNLHETAKYVAYELNGAFPRTYEELTRLKGIGAYAAAAIASIAFNQPVAAIDGNVKRVLSRLFLVGLDLNSARGRAQIKDLAESIIDINNPGLHNQAIMELGAIVCLPGKPRCPECPLIDFCLAFKENRIHDIPAQYHKNTIRERFLYYFIIISEDGKIPVHKRTKNDIWNGLYEFPLIETASKLTHEELSEISFKNFNLQTCDMQFIKISSEITHILTHQHLIVRFVHCKTQNKNAFSGIPDKWISITEFPELPVPRLIDRYVSVAGI